MWLMIGLFNNVLSDIVTHDLITVGNFGRFCNDVEKCRILIILKKLSRIYKKRNNSKNLNFIDSSLFSNHLKLVYFDLQHNFTSSNDSLCNLFIRNNRQNTFVIIAQNHVDTMIKNITRNLVDTSKLAHTQLRYVKH